MKKILITGGAGQIGSRVLDKVTDLIDNEDELFLLENRRKIEFFGKKVYIIRNVSDGGEYDAAFHLAANIHTKYCENIQRQGEFIRDNVILTEKVSNQAKRVILVSSDNVFNGMDGRDYKEDDPTDNPSNFYGVTKVEAEKIVLGSGGSVIRIQTMLELDHNLIIDRILEGIDGKDYWPFWTDQYVSPTFFTDFFEVVKRTYQNEKRGSIYHVSCDGETPSRAAIAQRVLEVHKKHSLPMRRETLEYALCDNLTFPRRLVLNTERTRKELGLEFTDVNVAIEKHVLRIRRKNS